MTAGLTRRGMLAAAGGLAAAPALARDADAPDIEARA